ncbi:MAG: hypothetical protein QOE45_2548 [Frankiaceae bacterium]|nr:hypothetical protein [Frankiaceae bacterium]
MTAVIASLMATELAEQAAVLRGLVARRGRLGGLAVAVPAAPTGIVFVARGSSANAAVYGRYVFELLSGRPSFNAALSVHTRYAADVDYTGFLAVGISQSGETPEVVDVLRRLRAAGARTVAVTNGDGSPLAAAADWCLPLDAGPELAVPATKTFTASLAALALVAEAAFGGPWSDADWAAVLDGLDEVLADDASPRALATALADATSLLCLGRGVVLPVALETALKLKEAAGVRAEGGSGADLRHGPVAGYPAATPVVSISSRGALWADAVEVEDWLRDRGHPVHLVSDRTGSGVAVPAVHELLAPLLLVVRGQQLALHSARARGLDPDRPAGLSKVTPTT